MSDDFMDSDAASPDSSALSSAVSAPPSQDMSALSTALGPAPTPPSPTMAPQSSPVLPTGQGDLNEYQAQGGGGGGMLKAILAGVLGAVGPGIAGAAAQRGRGSFAGGMAAGAQAELEYKFRTAADAARAAQLTMQDKELQLKDDAQKIENKKFVMEEVDWWKNRGVILNPTSNTATGAKTQFSGQMAQQGHIGVPVIALNDGDTIWHTDPHATDQVAAQTKAYNDEALAFNLPQVKNGVATDATLGQLQDIKFGRNITDHKPMAIEPLTQTIAGAQTYLDTLKKNPNADPTTVNKIQGDIDHLTYIRDKGIEAGAAQKGADATATNLGENTPAVASAKANTAKVTEQAKLDVTDSPANQNAKARGAAKIKAAELPYEVAKVKAEADAKNQGELNAVAFDPNYPNADGTKGANIVMNKSDAQAKGLQHYPEKASQVNTLVAGMNDVQNKLNQLAAVVTDTNRFAQVDPGDAAAMLAHDKFIQAEFHGVGVDLSRVTESRYAAIVQGTNQPTRDYVTAMVGAHEAITKLPYLQTMGKSNRMTDTQMKAAVNLLPQPGDGAMAAQKMQSLQGMIDPLRKQIPHMPGAESTPAWTEQKQATPTTTAPAAPTPKVNWVWDAVTRTLGVAKPQ